jgi:hypothetical protein
MKYFIKNDSIQKEVSKKHYLKIKDMERNIQEFFLFVKDFDLNKRYKVQQFETHIKGIDLLMINDLIMKDRKRPDVGLTLKGNLFYYNSQGQNVGYLGVNGINLYNSKT